MDNTVTGSGQLIINGVYTSQIITDTDNGVTRGRVVTAINAVSQQTGVTAVDTGDDANGIVLKALDGRNITVSQQTAAGGVALTAAKTGVSFGTTTGGYTLQSLDGKPIVLSATATGDISRAGLTSGNYDANTSVVTTGSRSPVDTTYPDSSKWTAGTLKINGVAISGTDPASDTASATADEAGDDIVSSSRSNSAIAIAAAINKSSALTGVKAVANANVIVGTEWRYLVLERDYHRVGQPRRHPDQAGPRRPDKHLLRAYWRRCDRQR
jgi:flagellin